MEVLRVEGPARLRGEVAVSGAKNAALSIMAASLLADGPITLERVPEVSDVTTLSQLLRHLGMRVMRSADDVVRMETIDPSRYRAASDLVRRMRASFCVLGPLLARRGRAIVSLPGGCNIGARPVDLHLKGLAALGADIRISAGRVIARAGRLRGTRINLRGPHGPTVTGTANVLCASVLAKGNTIIAGAATEPEIVDLGSFLIALGAEIEGLGTDELAIRGVDQLGTARHRIIPDRIEAATLLIAAAVTGDCFTVRDANAEHLQAVLDVLSAVGCQLNVEHDRIRIDRRGRLLPVDIVATPYPGIASDVQPQLVTLLTLADGTSSISDEVFPNRFAYVSELRRFGAMVHQTGCGVQVEGCSRLRGTQAVARDLRGGAALLLAGLSAEQTTLLGGLHHIDRGYQRLDEKLRQLGARIERRRPLREPHAQPASIDERLPTAV